MKLDDPNSILADLQSKDVDLAKALSERDSAAKLLQLLPQRLPVDRISRDPAAHEVWQDVGLFYMAQRRFHEALAVFWTLYQHMIDAQAATRFRLHKGMPLVWMSDCYRALDFPVHAKGYLMLTLCEDALRENGSVSPQTTGVYFRLVWVHGLSHAQLGQYAARFHQLALQNPQLAQSDMPVLERLAAEGACTWTASTIFPSLTLPSHTSMLTGVGPDKHRVSWNTWKPGKGVVRVPTIFAEAKKAGLSTAMFVGKEKFRHLLQPGTVDEFRFKPQLLTRLLPLSRSSPRPRSPTLCQHALWPGRRPIISSKGDPAFASFTSPTQMMRAINTAGALRSRSGPSTTWMQPWRKSSTRSTLRALAIALYSWSPLTMEVMPRRTAPGDLTI